MAAKRAKLTPIAKTKEGGFEGVTLYILPKKLSKSRVEFLISLACKRGFTVADSFRYMYTNDTIDRAAQKVVWFWVVVI